MSTQQTSNSLWNFSLDFFEVWGKAPTFFASDIILGRIARPIMVRTGLCMSNIMPSNSKRVISQVNGILTTPQKQIVKHLQLTPIQAANSISPLAEELQFRYLFQQLALRDIPQAFFNKFYPEKNISMDTTALKIFRTFLTAAIFTALHQQYAECEHGGGVETFIGSLIYSGLIESGESIILTIILHLMWNQFTPIIDAFIDSAIQ